MELKAKLKAKLGSEAESETSGGPRTRPNGPPSQGFYGVSTSGAVELSLEAGAESLAWRRSRKLSLEAGAESLSLEAKRAEGPTMALVE